jgi:hypothetical protein
MTNPPVPGSAHAPTPTPWRVFINTDGTRLVGIGAQDAEGILDAGFGVWAWDEPAGIANAELVVEAVNSHASLKARIEELEAALKSSEGYLLNAKIDLETGCTKATAIKTIEGGLKMIRAALSKGDQS